MARQLSQPQSHAQTVAQPQAAGQIVLQSFEDVVALIDARRDVVLKLDVAKFVRPVSFRPGAIEFEPAPGAPGNLAQRLPQRIRGQSLGLIYAVSISVFGGSTQFIVAWLTVVTHSPLAPAWYATAALAVSLGAMLLLPKDGETRRA